MSVLKPGRKVRIFLSLAAAFAVLFMSGCASISGLKPGGVGAGATETAENAWWYASFRINWPQDQDPSLNTDLLIAHRIISPVLDRHRQNIVLWRFHRRAARDEAGHRFSFIFYTTAANARKIYAEIDSSAVLDRMQAEGVVLKVAFDDTNVIKRAGVEATSDRNWSFPLQKAWPYFIMGVSQTWLDLIAQFAEDGRKKPVSTAEMLALYNEVGQKVEATWKKEGGHAFLHHLNALFGYGPVNIRDKVEMRF
jgi:uncharacterized protein YceK